MPKLGFLLLRGPGAVENFCGFATPRICEPRQMYDTTRLCPCRKPDQPDEPGALRDRSSPESVGRHHHQESAFAVPFQARIKVMLMNWNVTAKQRAAPAICPRIHRGPTTARRPPRDLRASGDMRASSTCWSRTVSSQHPWRAKKGR
jgi:hypothetical protein